MQIGIVGYGFVGRAMCHFLQHSHKLVIFDKHLPDLNSSAKIELVNSCDLVFICVPTPTDPHNLSGDMSSVFECVEWIQAPMCIKSTVLPGTTEALRARTGKQIAYSPEYLGEASDHPWHYESDCGFLIVGGDQNVTERVVEAYRYMVGEAFRFIVTDACTAELCKYMVNCFLATKVAFVNQFYEIASRLGVDYDGLRELWLVDPRIGQSHTMVTEERGFGGRCLPKDLQAIVSFMHDNGGTPLLQAVLAYNNDVRAGGGTRKSC